VNTKNSIAGTKRHTSGASEKSMDPYDANYVQHSSQQTRPPDRKLVNKKIISQTVNSHIPKDKILFATKASSKTKYQKMVSDLTYN
jgi:hypothetical protein